MGKKTKTALICCMILTASFFLTGLIMSLDQGAHAEGGSLQEVKSDMDKQEVQTENSYVLKDYHGVVAVFYKGSEQDRPILQTDISVSGLRAVDKELLADGIEVGSYEEVLKRLEDFSS